MELERSSGLLLHLSSLPGRHGIGSLGEEACQFADFLHQSHTRYWQILPIHPVQKKYGFSPYASPSTYAGNPLFINPFKLKEMHPFLPDYQGPLRTDDFIDYEFMTEHLHSYFREVYSVFFEKAETEDISAFQKFCTKHASWLEDYVLFTALSVQFETTSWYNWDKDIAGRKEEALNKYRKQFKDEMQYYSLLQFFFFEQWNELKEYCAKLGVEIIGDLPIYVGFSSADVWAHPEVFLLNEEGLADPVAGVPPDYFSETGQRWGNPLYKWNDEKGRLNEKTLSWWAERLKHQLSLFDMVRIDHFRAFESYWAIPRSEETAIKGEWIEGPGEEFFTEMNRRLGTMPLIAEDLGIITEKVRKLRRSLKLPGMKILQFAFDFSNDNKYLPHSIEDPNCVIYTGTHDNNTVNGWYYESMLDGGTKHYIKSYLNLDNDDCFHQKFIKAAMMTTAHLCIIPIQDLLGYGGVFRMNTPGTLNFVNWSWRLKTMNTVWQEKNFWRDLNRMYNRHKKEDS